MAVDMTWWRLSGWTATFDDISYKDGKIRARLHRTDFSGKTHGKHTFLKPGPRVDKIKTCQCVFLLGFVWTLETQTIFFIFLNIYFNVQFKRFDHGFLLLDCMFVYMLRLHALHFVLWRTSTSTARCVFTMSPSLPRYSWSASKENGGEKIVLSRLDKKHLWWKKSQLVERNLDSRWGVK